jgi:2-polyprenyl-6-methoxyphenol hydroxylase-like FAD-dependent oxidoreductase
VHTMTPHLGQGAGMAIEDAVVLSELLPQDRPIENLFDEFMQRRYDRCKFVQDASMQICQWQLDNDPNTDQAGMTKKMIIETAKPI